MKLTNNSFLRFLQYLVVSAGLLLTQNCVVRFEDNTRILVEGVVLDQFGTPIPNAEINVYTNRVTSPLGGESDFLLGSNYSDSNGVFSVVSLFDKDEDFSIEINAGDFHSKYNYRTSTLEFTPEDLTFSLQTVTLNKLSLLNYVIERTSGDGNTLQYSFSYLDEFCNEIYIEGILNEEESQCYANKFTNGLLNDNNPNREGSIKVPIGSQVEFTYAINETTEVTEFISINDTDNEFAFAY